ncbi:MAG: response regulator transcription factor [Acidobacteria bacterium]|nr:response regulator transcription factor [Acidobacteriota bacterium]
MKVLTVDDNEQARQMIKHYLRELSDEFRECADGAEAVSAYAEFTPDWVLMDWEMKQVNGLVATRDIIADFPDAKVLMVTNYDEKDLRQAARDAGGRGFVLKDDLLSLRSLLMEAQTH